MKFILAKKIGMTTIYNEDGTARNVTLVEAKDNVVTGVKTKEKNGYSAVQVGFKKDKPKNGRIYEEIKEFRSEKEDYNVNDLIKADQFEEEEKVIVTGITKAKGFQGVVKKWSFAGSPASHGHRHDLRAPGSIGGMYPQKVFKGKKMAGRMGGKQKTVKNLKVVSVDKEKGLLAIEGAIPGNNKGIVSIYTK
jgi:large subunit ribosomal protein L3